MGRPPKMQRVDYFPHMCIHKKTMFIIEQQYGNDGYAFWFKLLEQLGSENGHYLDTRVPHVWEFMQARTRISSGRCREILDHLARLDAIDRDLWEVNGIIWSQNFVDNLTEIYRKRNMAVPIRPSVQPGAGHPDDIYPIVPPGLFVPADTVSGAETLPPGSFRRGNPASVEFPRRKPCENGVSVAESAARIGQDRIGQERESARARDSSTEEPDHPPDDPFVQQGPVLDNANPNLAEHAFQAFKRHMPLREGKFQGEDECRKYHRRHPALWNTWIQCAKFYGQSRDVRDGFVYKPLNFLELRYQDWIMPVEPLGNAPPGSDVAWAKQREQWDAEGAEYAAKIASGEVEELPRPVPEWRQGVVVDKPDAGMG